MYWAIWWKCLTMDTTNYWWENKVGTNVLKRKINRGETERYPSYLVRYRGNEQDQRLQNSATRNLQHQGIIIEKGQ